MDLTEGAPFWPVRDGLVATYPPLDEDLDTEVAIVGAGITGALVADEFARAGIECVVLDKREAAHGSTGASTALLVADLDLPLVTLARTIGAERAARAYRLAHEGVREVCERAAPFGGCEFVARPSLLLAAADDHDTPLDDEAAARRRAGLDSSELDATELRDRYGFDRRAAVLTETGGEIDVYRFAHQLLGRAIKHGARVFDRTPVASIEGLGRGRVLLRTARGRTVRARRAILAAGYETGEFLEHAPARLRTTFALASAPTSIPARWRDRALICETGDPYLYVRTTGDGRVLIGGGDVEFSTHEEVERLIPEKARRLVEQFRSLFPELPMEIDWAWAGTFGETSDALPAIGRSPDYPRTLLAVGYGGNGIVFGALAARLLLDLHRGVDREDLALFNPTRAR